MSSPARCRTIGRWRRSRRRRSPPGPTRSPTDAAAPSTSTTTRATRSTAASRPRRPSATRRWRGRSGQVLLYAGKVANTFFFSSSGGRTAAVTDVFTGAKPTPYLVSVPDPWDTYSPYHNWGPGGGRRRLGRQAARDRGRRRAPAGARRAVTRRSVVVTGRNGDVTLPASDVRRALGLRSTWMSVGVLSLSRPVGVLAPDRIGDDQRQGDQGAEAGARAAAVAGGDVAARAEPVDATRRHLLDRRRADGDDAVQPLVRDDQERRPAGGGRCRHEAARDRARHARPGVAGGSGREARPSCRTTRSRSEAVVPERDPRVRLLAQDPVTDLAPVRVAIIDSGIDLDHPEFAGRIAERAELRRRRRHRPAGPRHVRRRASSPPRRTTARGSPASPFPHSC